eukprot:4282425-Pleurochrysis_carterae.AAC.2
MEAALLPRCAVSHGALAVAGASPRAARARERGGSRHRVAAQRDARGAPAADRSGGRRLRAGRRRQPRRDRRRDGAARLWRPQRPHHRPRRLAGRRTH